MTQERDSKPIKGNRYEILEKIGEGGMGAVYRVVDRLNGLLIALKQVLPATQNLQFTQGVSPDSTRAAAEVALANEFSILASLRHPNIVSVLDYGFDEDGQPFFTMDLIDAPMKITDATQQFDETTRIRLLIQVLQALAYLHQRGIIHRDLKPENILVTPDGQVRVLDFGLALSAEYAKQLGASVTGTLAYMAPEVLSGEPVSVASDLYTFGLIAYDVLGGGYPFNRDNLTSLIISITTETPKFDFLRDELRPIFERLLAKDPADRYQDVDFLIDLICQVTGYQRPRETLAIRESYLQTAEFVGRQSELEILESAMYDLKRGTGGMRLIAGESGVGKSRLLHELRVRSLVENVLVVRGQAVAEGSSPYRIWRDILRWLCLLAPVDDREAGILKTIIPDIETVVRHTVSDPAELSPLAEQERLINVIMDVVKRYQKPLIVILEDLHWAGSESLTLLERLNTLTKTQQLLLLASFRDDESPRLAERFPDAQVVRLNRLNPDQIANLSESILGKTGRNREIIAFLQKETGGNVFFVVEVLRSLAESAGELRKIAEQPLPDEIVAGGIIAVLHARINRVPVEARPALRLMAIIGRDINLRLFNHLFPELNADTWVVQCAEVAVLDVDGTRWYFSHDKLRERIIADMKMNPNDYRQAQQTVAQGIETVYGENREYVAALAHHWTEANVPEKASHYLQLAADQARYGDYQRAIEYAKRALAFDLHPAKKRSPERALLHSIIGYGHFGSGDYHKAEEHYNTALVQYGLRAIPNSTPGLLGGLLGELGRQVMHRLLPSVFVAQKPAEPVHRQMVSSLVSLQAVYSTTGAAPKALYTTFATMNIVEQVRPEATITPTMSYGAVVYITGLLGLHLISQFYKRLTEQVADLAMPLHRAQGYGLLGFYAVQQADWAYAVEKMQLVIQQFDEMHVIHSLNATRNMLGRVYTYMGQYEDARTVLNAAYASAKDHNDLQEIFHIFSSICGLLIRQGKLSLANFDDIDLLVTMGTATERFITSFESNPANRALYYLLRSAFFYLNDDANDARIALAQANDILVTRKIERNMIYFDLYALFAQLALVLRTEANDTICEFALKMLDQYAKVFRYAQPQALLSRGLDAQYQQQHAKALTLWQSALARSVELSMPYDRAQAHLAIAQAQNSSAPDQERNRDQAQLLLNAFGMVAQIGLMR